MGGYKCVSECECDFLCGELEIKFVVKIFII